jgi:hypothetical protein
MYIIPGFPRIVLDAKVLPFHQVPEFPVDHLAVQDLFYNPLFFSVDDLRRWRR